MWSFCLRRLRHARAGDTDAASRHLECYWSAVAEPVSRPSTELVTSSYHSIAAASALRGTGTGRAVPALVRHHWAPRRFLDPHVPPRRHRRIHLGSPSGRTDLNVHVLFGPPDPPCELVGSRSAVLLRLLCLFMCPTSLMPLLCCVRPTHLSPFRSRSTPHVTARHPTACDRSSTSRVELSRVPPH